MHILFLNCCNQKSEKFRKIKDSYDSDYYYFKYVYTDFSGV